ncbi:MAG: glycosyltransferase [Chloroflexi bacterium]|nr:glycosyltransferase [Chloroflexota bacterium]MDA1146922.1 glycosyltransferase [Chloroflexota bacterium]
MTPVPRVTPSEASRIAVLSMHTSPLAPLGGAATGGMNVYVHEVSERLAERGRTIDVFTRRDDPAAPMITEFAPGARLIQIEAGPAAPLPKTDLIHHTAAFAAGIEAFRASEGTHYDLIHSHYWLSGVAGERLTAEWGVPHVAMFHTLGEVKLRARASEHEPPERLEAERRLVQSLDRVIAATSYEERLLRQVYGVPADRIDVIPLGVDPERFHPGSREAARRQLGIAAEDRIVLAVGRIEPLKGLDILIRAIAQITDQRALRLLIIGGDEQARPEFDRLSAIAEEVGVRHLVSFVGAIAHHELPEYYRAADVVVMPSFSESFGLVAVEAMASGVPVVVSRVGGLASTVADGRTGYLVPWRCPEPFAEKIELLLRNEPLRKALGAAGVERMRDFSWHSVAERLLLLYDELARDGVARTAETAQVADAASAAGG